jgi:hypothetical protein
VSRKNKPKKEKKEMKKQWILIGTMAVVLAIAGTVFGLNQGAGETIQGSLSEQVANTNIMPKYWDEVQSAGLSPEGWPHELFVLRSVPQTPRNVVYYDIPEYDGQPLPEGFFAEDNIKESNINIRKMYDMFPLPEVQGGLGWWDLPCP